jgi:hypothetical protein
MRLNLETADTALARHMGAGRANAAGGVVKSKSANGSAPRSKLLTEAASFIA